MKIKLILLLAIVFTFACKNQTTETTTEIEETPQEEVQMLNVQKIELSIDGMTCTGCENAIQKTIDEFEGVYTSKADHQKGIATIEVDSTLVNIIDIENAITMLGYEFKGHSVMNE